MGLPQSPNVTHELYLQCNGRISSIDQHLETVLSLEPENGVKDKWANYGSDGGLVLYRGLFNLDLIK